MGSCPPSLALPREIEGDQMIKPHGKRIDHVFTRTTIVGDHVFFAGQVDIAESLLNRHKAEVDHQRALQERAAEEQGMSVQEMLESRRIGVVAPAPVDFTSDTVGKTAEEIEAQNLQTDSQDNLNNRLAKGFAGEAKPDK